MNNSSIDIFKTDPDSGGVSVSKVPITEIFLYDDGSSFVA